MTNGIKKGPRFDQVNDPQVEQRVYQSHSYTSGMGKSSCLISCPFCHADVRAFLWSLAGGGKRCPCGAIFGGTGSAYHWREVTI